MEGGRSPFAAYFIYRLNAAACEGSDFSSENCPVARSSAAAGARRWAGTARVGDGGMGTELALTGTNGSPCQRLPRASARQERGTRRSGTPQTDGWTAPGTDTRREVTFLEVRAQARSPCLRGITEDAAAWGEAKETQRGEGEQEGGAGQAAAYHPPASATRTALQTATIAGCPINSCFCG